MVYSKAQVITQTMNAASPDDPPPQGSEAVTQQDNPKKKDEGDHNDHVSVKGAGCCGGCCRSNFWNGLRRFFSGGRRSKVL
jgi:hypothetical protein